MIDLASVAERKSTTISDLKRRGSVIHEEVGHAGKVYSLRFGDHEDMAVVPLDGLVALATAYSDLLDLLAALERQVSAQVGMPLLGGPDEDDLVRKRLSESRRPGPEVIAAARAKLGLQ